MSRWKIMNLASIFFLSGTLLALYLFTFSLCRAEEKGKGLSIPLKCLSSQCIQNPFLSIPKEEESSFTFFPPLSLFFRFCGTDGTHGFFFVEKRGKICAFPLDRPLLFTLSLACDQWDLSLASSNEQTNFWADILVCDEQKITLQLSFCRESRQLISRRETLALWRGEMEREEQGASLCHTLKKTLIWLDEERSSLLGSSSHSLSVRLGFCESEGNFYSHTLFLGDALIWNGKSWILPPQGCPTHSFPTLFLKKIQSEQLHIRFLSSGDHYREEILLPKSSEEELSSQLFVSWFGASTRSQRHLLLYVGEQKKYSLQSGDQLLYTRERGWERFDGSYNQNQERGKWGTLFVFEGVERGESGEFFYGSILSPLRTRQYHLTMALRSPQSLQLTPL